MCRGDRPLAPTGASDDDQPDCADRKRRLSSAKVHAEGRAPGHTKVCIPGGCPLQPALPPRHLKLPSHLCSLFGCFRKNLYI